ncbi:CydX/CbdX family cytochrome bd oxidase small subunit [Phocoenobacter skyensis]|uniref:Cyd operon protein YbgT n=1 Tax=Phocoenobacter skyensis TaxID=97481 RepID=A0A1H7WXG7_9PAST|nr:CydX/CbdX family cytochrome bd oxidase small subunit [Pasteurella skyensis]MDP8079298.1 CydX/CbdX family cytochrome bd oxidase small subunit [Pasteurella skyensis]MDP8085481.1 CydX/CbdX family cytochrome bd oxidase small subunit [Pasteurella skyensis]MDP8161628.1 CydX/CbdX family cytochrome bd oxidase small subunit [Pasteurella skyensis]MDP8170507.1 CydX/CbdX family cytochrome bd oxidase small subunit [Pasteurella skyensis]MDP8171784.1 CydX/CbdX family cytochrome bd oxidase small subunit [P
MFYVTWVLGVSLAILFSVIMTVKAEKTGKLDE